MSDTKVTIYTTSEFMGNVVKYEGKLLNLGRKDYAQYKNCPYVDFIPKRKRKGLRILKSYNPYIIVIDGWNNPDPEDMMQVISNNNNMQVKQSKYSSFDDNYKLDFNAQIDAFIKQNGIEPLMDVR